MNYMFGSHARQYSGKSHGNDIGEYTGFLNHKKFAQEIPDILAGIFLTAVLDVLSG